MDFSEKYGKFLFRGVTLFVFFITVTKYEVVCGPIDSDNYISPAVNIAIIFKFIILFQILYWLFIMLDYPFDYFPHKRYFQYGFYIYQFLGALLLLILVGTRQSDVLGDNTIDENCQKESSDFVKDVVFTYLITLLILLLRDCLGDQLWRTEG